MIGETGATTVADERLRPEGLEHMLPEPVGPLPVRTEGHLYACNQVTSFTACSC